MNILLYLLTCCLIYGALRSIGNENKSALGMICNQNKSNIRLRKQYIEHEEIATGLRESGSYRPPPPLPSLSRKYLPVRHLDD
jgi:hypothetical protein